MLLHLIFQAYVDLLTYDILQISTTAYSPQRWSRDIKTRLLPLFLALSRSLQEASHPYSYKMLAEVFRRFDPILTPRTPLPKPRS